MQCLDEYFAFQQDVQIKKNRQVLDGNYFG